MGGDPVVAWSEARIEIDAEAPEIKRNAVHGGFTSWAKSEGFSEHTLPGVNSRSGSLPGRRGSAGTPTFLRAHFPGAVQTDDRPGAPRGNIYWTANVAEAGHYYIFGYESVWLPQRFARRRPAGCAC